VLTVAFSTGDLLEYELPDSQVTPDNPDTGPACPKSTSCPFPDLSVVVPEPGTSALLGAGGALAVAVRRWQRGRQRS